MNDNLSEQDLLNYLITHNQFKEYCKDMYPFPKPYQKKNMIKTFVLGTDPDKQRIEYVFGLEYGNSPYFSETLSNLNECEIRTDSIYVQNLCRNYMKESTEDNKKWLKIAELWIPYLRKEFNTIDESREIPVLITADKLRDVLCYDVRVGKNYKYHYENAEFIKPEENKLGRWIIPFYRHPYYSLTDARWSAYKEKIKNEYSTLSLYDKESTLLNCQKCGNQVSDMANYCSQCGFFLK